MHAIQASATGRGAGLGFRLNLAGDRVQLFASATGALTGLGHFFPANG